ncbi:DNA-processing protein DprA [Actinomarinicola tropica]|uniref:Uncharacterized protein n=1 Tax=Actinomarinicola tropica TaxID=2789776 RepID=A0A5Q2RDC0_9ACTN|nr:DNA-processing protein DprA [Actinomarinicola tropica]QGG94858.1 hypothetical protein GH723_06900 [Actinomarinicola tropica]
MERDATVQGAAAALASLPLMGPRRLRAVVDAWGFTEGWARVAAGEARSHPHVAEAMGNDAGELARRWAAAARGVDSEEVARTHREAGVEILVHGGDRFPPALADDLEPPVVLFARGDLRALDGPRVGIVGTRRATAGGRQTATELGRDLARAGVRVVSGLALGIDGAAHRGALHAGSGDDGRPGGPVVGVVGTGLDVVYPRRHADLWREVGERGLLLGEVPLGGAPTRWRFPARNRLIAALSDVLVVVESHERGGALHTVEEAQRRDVAVMAVPGSVRVGSCQGTNRLLVEGATPALSAADVLTALDLSSCDRLPLDVPVVADPPSRPAPRSATDPGPRRASPPVAAVLEPGDADLLAHLGGEPVPLDRLAVRAGIDLGELSLRLARLELAGRVVRHGSAVEEVS